MLCGWGWGGGKQTTAAFSNFGLIVVELFALAPVSSPAAADDFLVIAEWPNATQMLP